MEVCLSMEHCHPMPYIQREINLFVAITCHIQTLYIQPNKINLTICRKKNWVNITTIFGKQFTMEFLFMFAFKKLGELTVPLQQLYIDFRQKLIKLIEYIIIFINFRTTALIESQLPSKPSSMIPIPPAIHLKFGHRRHFIPSDLHSVAPLAN